MTMRWRHSDDFQGPAAVSSLPRNREMIWGRGAGVEMGETEQGLGKRAAEAQEDGSRDCPWILSLFHASTPYMGLLCSVPVIDLMQIRADRKIVPLSHGTGVLLTSGDFQLPP